MNEPIAEREFTNKDGTITLKIFAPMLEMIDGNEDWTSEPEITWPSGRVIRRKAHGVDSMQALLLNIAMANNHIHFPVVGERDKSLKYFDIEGTDLVVPQYQDD
ncbi:DUF6968 family protein [Sphingomicrobium clamense]|uniref:DUF6968 domain-containing protein n=1 Tax=Sphingomicrobium clamense TaxID=2851013 RepID=A0ABS6V7B7_9SPHN|nr:hypothetical protein [Sphingomicrobium sp. B8]MBW0145413.1 hypothetical protein [Sphingomicrobium sp. B8]